MIRPRKWICSHLNDRLFGRFSNLLAEDTSLFLYFLPKTINMKKYVGSILILGSILLASCKGESTLNHQHPNWSLNSNSTKVHRHAWTTSGSRLRCRGTCAQSPVFNKDECIISNWRPMRWRHWEPVIFYTMPLKWSISANQVLRKRETFCPFPCHLVTGNLIAGSACHWLIRIMIVNSVQPVSNLRNRSHHSLDCTYSIRSFKVKEIPPLRSM